MVAEFNKKKNVRRNTGLLLLAQAAGISNQAIIMAVGALTGVILSPSQNLATVPTTALIVGLALTAGPATRVIRQLGRKTGLLLGAALGVISGLVAALAVFIGSFPLFVIALGVVGCSSAFAQQYRFAIADSVPGEMQARAISLVLLGGVAAGFLGPRMSYYAKDWIPGAEYAGSYLFITLFSLVAFGLIAQTRLAPVATSVNSDSNGRSAMELLKAPEIHTPIVTGLVSYSLMTLVMVAAPLAMVHIYGHSPKQATTTIQWHVIAMYAPSLVTGNIINKIGAHLMIGIGFLLISAAALVNLHGITTTHFDVALILLGVGWNFGFVGSTTLLSRAYRPEEASTAQGLNEPFVFGTTAIAAVASGVLVLAIGWQAVNQLVLIVVAFAVLLLFRDWRRLTRMRER